VQPPRREISSTDAPLLCQSAVVAAPRTTWPPAHPPSDDAHREVADLLQRRDRLITLYNGLTRDLTTERDLTTTRSHDHNNRLQL
jgi:hypothetical protein